MKKFYFLTTFTLFSLAITSCGFPSSSSPSSAGTKVPELFSPIEKDGSYTRTFYSNFPLDNPKSSLVASDASGKGPFTAYIACSEGEEMAVSIDSEIEKTVPCDESVYEIHEIQKIALSGGIKATVESSKKSGSWQIQFLSSRSFN
ncbi:hypothetical protein ACN08Z_00820 [Rothia sp. P7181]|uniref:hypothetical protein n=1 Tax=unclassified Rothia (in: high G+C Gram-positive bacteria) TaxID=2689056 RepID=UPI003ACAF6E2